MPIKLKIAQRRKFMTKEEENILEDIKSIYPKKLLLTKKEVAVITNRSESSLNRDIAEGVGIAYKKMRGGVRYHIRNIAKYLFENVVKTV